MSFWSEILPVAGGVLGGVFGEDVGLDTGSGAALGGLAGAAGQRAMGGGALTGSPASPGRKGILPSTEGGRRLLGALQEEILRTPPVNLHVNGRSIPIMSPFLNQKARVAKTLMGGTMGGMPADGGILGGIARPLGAAAEIFGRPDNPNNGMVDLGKPSWGDLMNWLPGNDESWLDGWSGEY